MKCSYDDWTTQVVKSITPKMRDVLMVMADGECRTRANMLHRAGIDPNPRTEMGYVGNERTDFYLYKKGLIKLVGYEAKVQKVFQITPAGMEEASK